MNAKPSPSMMTVLRACANGDDLKSPHRLGLLPHVYAKAELECRRRGLKVAAGSNELTEAGLAAVAA